MSFSKQTLLTAFALFSLFFGAGNLILPPYLGYNAGEDWLLVLLGFVLSAVVIPIIAIYSYARLQGTMMDFAKKVSPFFALIYCILIYAISISLPAPRTASVTYEMAIQPYFEISSLLISTFYFALVLVFVLNRSQILSIIGKFLTPLIILILVCIIGIGLFNAPDTIQQTTFDSTFAAGILEGYQTFDAIGGVVVGGVIVISLALQGKYNYEEKKRMMASAGLIAGAGLILIYGGLIAIGAYYNDIIQTDNRTVLLTMLSTRTLGSIGTTFLAVLVALACFTTAVGIVAGTADFVKGITKNSKMAFTLTAVFACVVGVLIGQFDVHYIIDIAVPALMFIYPVTIVLILLNAIPQKYASPSVFKLVAIFTLVFSIPDFMYSITGKTLSDTVEGLLPFAQYRLGWVIPALLTFVLVNLYEYWKDSKEQVDEA